MNYKQLLELARKKALEAQAILEGETPDQEAADKLLAEAAEYRERAERIKKALTIVEETKPEPEKATNPSPSGLVVTGDEADRAQQGNPFKSLGEFLMAVKDAGMGHVADKRLLPLRSKDPADEGGFSLNGAMGDEFVGGLVKSAFMKQTGLNEGLGAMGGFLVDTDRAGGIMQRVYNVGDLIQRVDMVGVSANSNGMVFNAVAETSRADGQRQGGILAYWTAEAGVKTPSHPTFRQIELRLHKCVALVYSTDELLQDASALESWIMRNLPEEIRFVVEDSIFNGTGVGMPLGIMGHPSLITQLAVPMQAAATIVGQNIMDMWSRLYPPSRRNAVWFIDQSVEPELYNMAMGVGTGGVALYQPPGGLSQTPYATLMGRPVIATEYQVILGTTGDIALFDLSEYQMIEKGGIQTASSIHVAFLTDETLFRFVYRVDGQPKWNATLTPNSGGPTQSPFVVLATRP
jgi:HK97 family phage major capsid protein